MNARQMVFLDTSVQIQRTLSDAPEVAQWAARLIYALTGESMVSIIDRLITQELERIQQEKQEQSFHDQKSL